MRSREGGEKREGWGREERWRMSRTKGGKGDKWGVDERRIEVEGVMERKRQRRGRIQVRRE